MSYSGYDIEDALVLNKASIDRGFGRCIVLRKYACSLKTYPNQAFDRIVPPPPEPTNRKGPPRKPRYDTLDEDGICSPGLPIALGDIYINKQTPINTRDPISSLENIPDTGNFIMFFLCGNFCEF